MKFSFKGVLLLLFVGLWVTACQPDDFTDNPDAVLGFSADTLTFDTVFTTVGSTTGFFKIYNTERKALKISSIQLGGGENSMFRINVNGTPGSTATDVEIGGNDSLYVFVEVTVDPNQEDLPFLVTDSIMFNTNGNEQQIKLVAYGQNAHYFNDQAVEGIEVFENDRPYLVYNRLRVNPNSTLTLKEGVRFFMHPGACIEVQGTLNLEGELDSMIVFEGDRLEDYFDDLPAQWNGIYVARGGVVNMNYTHINESTDGVFLGFLPKKDTIEIQAGNPPQLNIQNSIISNCLSRNILGLRSVVQATNCQFTNSSLYNIELALGGLYDFQHCTIVNYGGGAISHRDPILRMANYAALGGTLFSGDDLTVEYKNCIIHGSEDEEIFFDILSEEDGGLPINYTFNHCLLKTEIDTAGNNAYVNCILNPASSDTLFVDRFEEDFHLNNEAPAINAGILSTISTDFDGIPRDGEPDLGCYEFQ